MYNTVVLNLGNEVVRGREGGGAKGGGRRACILGMNNTLNMSLSNEREMDGGKRGGGEGRGGKNLTLAEVLYTNPCAKFFTCSNYFI